MCRPGFSSESIRAFSVAFQVSADILFGIKQFCEDYVFSHLKALSPERCDKIYPPLELRQWLSTINQCVDHDLEYSATSQTSPPPMLVWLVGVCFLRHCAPVVRYSSHKCTCKIIDAVGHGPTFQIKKTSFSSKGNSCIDAQSMFHEPKVNLDCFKVKYDELSTWHFTLLGVWL